MKRSADVGVIAPLSLSKAETPMQLKVVSCIHRNG